MVSPGGGGRWSSDQHPPLIREPTGDAVVMRPRHLNESPISIEMGGNTNVATVDQCGRQYLLHLQAHGLDWTRRHFRPHHRCPDALYECVYECLHYISPSTITTAYRRIHLLYPISLCSLLLYIYEIL